MGADLQSLDSGCCGMAGPFGFEKDKYAVSQAIGERVLLPAVAPAAPDTLIVCDGFSCREQIFQATGRRPLHFAELAASKPKTPPIFSGVFNLRECQMESGVILRPRNGRRISA